MRGNEDSLLQHFMRECGSASRLHTQGTQHTLVLFESGYNALESSFNYQYKAFVFRPDLKNAAFGEDT